MNIMIHTCKEREWYVRDYLAPSIMEQGAWPSEIKIWLDDEGKGNLFACMDSFASFEDKQSDSTWHLQDDVIVSKNFYEVASNMDNSYVVCGYCGKDFGPNPENDGLVFPWKMWFSFPCIQIPNDMAFRCSKWFYEDAQYRSHRDDMKKRIRDKKSDDWFFKQFMLESEPYADVLNLKPNLVDHVDFLLGGSAINKKRNKDTRAVFFDDQDSIEKLKQDLKRRSSDNGKL